MNEAIFVRIVCVSVLVGLGYFILHRVYQSGYRDGLSDCRRAAGKDRRWWS